MLSKTTKYGLKTIMFLAEHSNTGHMYVARDLATELEIPQHFLSKILQDLSRKDLIASRKGPGGGFYLDEEHLALTPYDYVQALEGGKFLDHCILDPKPCKVNKPCIFHHSVAIFKDRFRKEFTQKALRDYVI